MVILSSIRCLYHLILIVSVHLSLTECHVIDMEIEYLLIKELLKNLYVSLVSRLFIVTSEEDGSYRVMFNFKEINQSVSKNQRKMWSNYEFQAS